MGESTMTAKLSIVLPCYNTPNLLDNLAEVLSVAKTITKDFEIILVDDGSKEFPDIIQTDKVKVITNEKNMGKGYSLRRGFGLARGNIISFIDADLEIPATLLKPYYQIMQGNRNPDILVGSKRHFNSSISYPMFRRLLSFIFQTMNRLMFGLVVLDTQSGIKFFKRDIIKQLLPYLYTNGFAVDLEILSLAQRKGYKIIEGPINIKKSFSSTISIWAIFRMIRDSFNIWFRYKFKKEVSKK